MKTRPTFLNIFVLIIMLTFILNSVECFARAGGGRSFGSRGSRSISPSRGGYGYARPQYTQPQYARPQSPPNPSYQRTYVPPPQMPAPAAPASAAGGFFRNMAAGVAGGILGNMLFKSLGFGGESQQHAVNPAAVNPGGAVAPGVNNATNGGPAVAGAAGSSSGFSWLGIFFLAGLALLGFMLYRMFTGKKNGSNLNRPQGYSANNQLADNQLPDNQNDVRHDRFYSNEFQQNDVPNAEQMNHDSSSDTRESVDAQLDKIRYLDQNFIPEEFKEQCVDRFFNIQAAWMDRNLHPVRDILEEDVYRNLEEDARQLKNNGHINKVENVAVRKNEIVEAWQEQGKNFITLHFHANLLDYTIDEKNGSVVDGNKSSPVKFEELWTYSRDIYSKNPHDWKLSAIQQVT
ncbi:MAG: Tim44/TimA family putative adaptor protein [Oligoflexia bacterium]|nr:Tim44/TimA family putative adaptor protein [Oligoflexia bacterium]